MMRSSRGFTLAETLLTFAILGVVVLFVHRLGIPVFSYFQHSQVRQKTNNEARSCLNTINTAMKGGLANSVRITTPVGISAPNSRIDFTLAVPLPSQTTAYAFYLAADRTVQMQEYSTVNATEPSPKTLATNVTGLIFTGDYRDPSIIYVSLRFDAAFESSLKTGSLTTISIPNQEIHMVLNH